MGVTVVGVVRSATGLSALTYEADASSDPMQPWLRSHRYGLRPLAETERPALWASWRSLEAVREWNHHTLADVLEVLRETVPSSDSPGDLPALGADVQPPPEPRATAAHPRAFRGTKYQLPKARQPDPVDVRAYLLRRRHTDQVLEQLGQPRGFDAYGVWNHGVEASTMFDPAFVMHLLPLFRGCNGGEVGAFATLSRTLGLHVRPDLRAALVGLFLAAEKPARALGWWRYVEAHEERQRLELAQIVVSSGVAKSEPFEPAFAAQIAALTPVQQWSMYRGIAGGAAPDYVISGLELDAISPSRIEDVPPGLRSVTSLVEAAIERLHEAMEEDSGADFWRAQLWRLCGYQPTVVELLGSSALATLSTPAAFWALRVANSPRWSPQTAEKEWRELGPRLPVLIEIAARIPSEYQRKFIEDMGDVYWWAIDNDHSVSDALVSCLPLCQRLSKPPFSTTSSLGALLPSLALVFLNGEFDPQRREIRTAPDESWLALEAACKRRNDARLLLSGFNRFHQMAPKLLATSFSSSPGAVVQTAESLASISYESAKEVLVAYSRSPLAADTLQDAPLEQLCAAVEPIAQAGGPNPIRRALRDHLSGVATLSEVQLRGHRERIIADLGVVRLAAIRQGVERVLAARIGIEKIGTPAMRHALEMLTDVDVHRRQLKRMLAATAAGDASWRLRHPLTREWLRRHSRISVEAWTDGVELRRDVDALGEVRLALEKDPLEALKLGTYVGSCLGRGGNLEYSAAAVVLDINKQVVYARDSNGTVIGRQLVALSENEELVCFHVYGSARPALLDPLFRDFDHALAQKLGVPLLGQRSTEYVIASILSHRWWDDTPWIDEPDQTA